MWNRSGVVFRDDDKNRLAGGEAIFAVFINAATAYDCIMAGVVGATAPLIP
jgi:hypothetical protein